MSGQSVGAFEINPVIERLEMLASRLERLSADSIYAHRASGYRGNILRILEHLRDSDQPVYRQELEDILVLVDQAFDIMTAAAREIA